MSSMINPLCTDLWVLVGLSFLLSSFSQFAAPGGGAASVDGAGLEAAVGGLPGVCADLAQLRAHGDGGARGLAGGAGAALLRPGDVALGRDQAGAGEDLPPPHERGQACRLLPEVFHLNALRLTNFT